MHQLSLMASQMNFTDAVGCEMSGKGARRRMEDGEKERERERERDAPVRYFTSEG